MLEIQTGFYSIRNNALKLKSSDFFKAVYYGNYQGPKDEIPFYYKIYKGHTIVIDLRLSLEDIFAAMKSNTRNEIRRAEREGCVCAHNYDYESFAPFYNDFSYAKGLDDFMTVDRLSKWGKPIITVVKKDGITLSMHATAFDNETRTAFLLYSCSSRLDDSADTKLIGWGNRLLHYKDFKLFKEMGYEAYNWSGVCTDPEQKEKYRIGQFKMSFGGEPVETIVLMTPLFVLMNNIKNVIYRFKR